MRTRSGATTVLLLTLMTGCIPGVNEQTSHAQHPSTSEKPRTVEERGEPQATVIAAIEGDVVTLRAEETTECQTKMVTPLEDEVTTERSLSSGTLAQTINVGTAALLIAGGIAVYSSAGGTCKKTPEPTEQNQNPASRPCTPDEANENKKVGQGLGIGMVSLSVLPIGAFVWNLFRAKNDKETVQVKPKEESSGWKACAHKPLANVNLVMSFAGGVQKSFTTDASGTANVSLASLDLPAKAFESPDASVVIQGSSSKPTKVSIATTPTYSKRTEWESKDEKSVAHSCGQYLEWHVYADYLQNNTAKREFYKGGDIPRATEFCNLLYVFKKCPDYIDDPEHHLCGSATFEDVVLSGMAQWGSQKKLLDQADYTATFTVKVMVQNGAKDPALSGRIATIRSTLQKDISSNSHSFHIPPGTMEDLQRVSEVLPAFRARSGEQDKTMNWQEDVIRDFKDCVRRCVGKSANLPGCQKACQQPGTGSILQQNGLVQ